MKHSRVLRTSVIVAAIVTASLALAQEESELTVQKLSETVYVLFGDGGNIGVSAGP